MSIWDVQTESWLDLALEEEPELTEDSVQDEQDALGSGYPTDFSTENMDVDEQIDVEAFLGKLEDEIDDRLVEQSFQSRQASVQAFTPRLLHSSTVVYSSGSPYLIVVGGYRRERSFTYVLGSLQILDLSTLKWSPTFRIPQRYSHSSVLLPSISSSSNFNFSQTKSIQVPPILVVGGRDELGAHVLPEDGLLLDGEGYITRWKSWEQETDGLTSSSSMEKGDTGKRLWRSVGSGSLEKGQLAKAGKGRADLIVFGSRLVLYGECLEAQTASYSNRMQALVLDLGTGIWASLAPFVPEETLDQSGMLVLQEDKLGVITFGNQEGSSTKDGSLFHLSEGLLDEALGFRSRIPTSPPSLSKDLSALFLDQRSHLLPPADFQIISSSGSHPPVFAHKLVLLSRWPHLASLLESGMREAQDGQLILKESYETIKAFVHFIYTDELPDFSNHLQEDRSEAYPSRQPVVTDPQGEKVWRTLLSLLSLSSIYLIPRLFQLSSTLLKSSYLSALNVNRIYNSSLTFSPPDFHQSRALQQVGPRSRRGRFNDGDSSGLSLAKLSREWLQDLAEFSLPRLQLITDLNQERKRLFQSFSALQTSLEEETIFEEMLEEELQTLIPTSNTLPTLSLHPPDQDRVDPLSVNSQAQFEKEDQGGRRSSFDEVRTNDYQSLLAQVSSRLNHTDPSSFDANLSSSSSYLQSRVQKKSFGAHSPSFSHPSSGSSSNSISHSPSPTSRVLLTLADVSSGRATPCNMSGTVYWSKDMAVDHLPE